MGGLTIVAVAWSLLLPAPAVADITDQMNLIRSQGCDGRSGVGSPLRKSRGLVSVAKEWAEGGPLEAAFLRAGYPMARSASISVSGPDDDRALAEVLRRNYCQAILNAAYSEVGVFRRGAVVWIVMAAPFVALKPEDAEQVREEVLALVNEARAKPRKCGRTRFDAVPPLALSAMLSHAALIHTQDMSQKNFLKHEGSDGGKVVDRLARIGYAWRAAGENIAMGADDARTVVRGWLDSPGHCSNIMSASFTEMGVAYMTNLKSTAGTYWTQVFAAPLPAKLR